MIIIQDRIYVISVNCQHQLLCIVDDEEISFLEIEFTRDIMK